MKLTREYLKQLIKEEMFKEPTPARPVQTVQTPQSSEKEQGSDVTRVLSYIDKIDTPEEYMQLINSIVRHAGNIRNGKFMLRQIYKALPSVIKKMK